MADNLDVTIGSGATVGADEITSVKYQRIKLIHGADGTNDGDVSTANGLPVQQQTGEIFEVGGDVANDAVDSGSPVKIGGQARTSNPTAVSSGDRVNFIADKLGKQVVVGSIRDLKNQQITTITSSTAETTVFTAVASVFLDIYGVIVTNTSATPTEVSFKDSTGGTTRFMISVPANDMRGFMLPESGAYPQATVNNNWTATCADSVASIVITLMAVRTT